MSAAEYGREGSSITIESSHAHPQLAKARISSFIDQVTHKRGAHLPGSCAQRAVAKLIPANSRLKARSMISDVLSPWQKLKARQLARQGEVRLHLGSGELPRSSWINVDLFGVPVQLVWNLNRNLPFADESVDAIFHEHVLEHLSIDHGLRLTAECFRILKPGGVLRIAVPDVQIYFGYYNRKAIPEARNQTWTPLMNVLQEFYGQGHRVMYDFETLAVLCHAAGFTDVERREFGQSALSSCPDHEWRKWDSVYAEMVK
jgi:predicted SAM-dependent methyltransferase